MIRQPPRSPLFPYPTLFRSHTALAARADEIARIVGLELGTPLKIAKAVQAGPPLTVPRGDADLAARPVAAETLGDRKSTRLNSSHPKHSLAVFCLKKKNIVP